MSKKKLPQTPVGHIEINEGEASIKINEERLRSIFKDRLKSILDKDGFKEDSRGRRNYDNKNMIIIFGDESVTELVDKVINADSSVDAEMKSKNPKGNLKALICLLIKLTTKLLHPKKYKDFLKSMEELDSELYEFLIESERDVNESENGIRETDAEKTDRLVEIQEKRKRKKDIKHRNAFYIGLILSITTFVISGIYVNWVFAFIMAFLHLPAFIAISGWVSEAIYGKY